MAIRSVRLPTTMFTSFLVLALSTPAFAAPIAELEPNNSLSQAQSINGAFTTEANPLIAYSTTIPHVTVQGLAGDGSFDYFSFNVGAANSLGIFDIDFARDLGSDSFLRLFNSSGVSLAFNDDSQSISDGGLGSTSRADSYLEYRFADPGLYFVRVGDCCITPTTEKPQNIGAGYQLQISLENPGVAAVPEPSAWTMLLLGFGAVGYSMRSRKSGHGRLQAV